MMPLMENGGRILSEPYLSTLKKKGWKIYSRQNFLSVYVSLQKKYINSTVRIRQVLTQVGLKGATAAATIVATVVATIPPPQRPQIRSTRTVKSH